MVEKFDITFRKGAFEIQKRIEKRRTNRTDRTWYFLGLVGQIGYAIAIPLAGGALLGSYIDRKTGWYPAVTLTGIGFGFMLSAIGFVHVIGDVMSAKNK